MKKPTSEPLKENRRHRNRRSIRHIRPGEIDRRQKPPRRIIDDIDHAFENLGYLITRYKWSFSILSLSVIIFFSLQIPGIDIDTSSEAMLHEKDPARLEYNGFRDLFGRSELIILAIEPDCIFTKTFFKNLKKFHYELENELPFLRRVTSLINVRETRGEENEIVVEELIGNRSINGLQMDALKDSVMANPYFIDHVISGDGKIAAVIIETEASIEDSDNVTTDDIIEGFEEQSVDEDNITPAVYYFSEKENKQLVAALNRVIRRNQSDEFPISASGGSIILNVFNRVTMADMKKCLGIGLFCIIVFLLIMFRRPSGVILPVLVILSAVACTLGLMSLLKVPVKIVTTVLPAFLIAVSVGDSVHILAIFYRHYIPGTPRNQAISYAMGHSGLAVVMTTLTTAAGLLSFSFAELSAIADLGRFAAAGVCFALLHTLVLLPALICILPIKPKQGRNHREATMDKILLGFARFSTTRPITIITGSALIFIVSIVGVFQLKFSENIVEHFPDDMNVKKDLKLIDDRLRGIITLEILVDTGKENGMYEPAVLDTIDKITSKLSSVEFSDIYIGKVFSANDILKEIHQALHDNSPQHYTIAMDRNSIAQEFLLFENSDSDDLQRVVDSRYQKSRITIKTPWVDNVIFREFISEVRKLLAAEFQNQATFTITGGMALMARTIPVALASMTRSYCIAMVVITIMMVLLVADLKIGLVSMAPNCLPIVLTMGLMGIFRVPLDMTSLMIGSIALGIVVDDTVHFIYNFKRYYKRSKNARKAVEETLLGTGRAMLITSLVLSAGFFADMAATLNHIVRFGFFTGITIIFALLADFILAPALMVRIYSYRKSI